MIERIVKWLPLTLLHASLILLPLLFTAGSDELFEFPKMLFVYAIAVGLVLSWVLKALSQKKLEIPRTPFDIPIALFVLSQFLSTVFSINLHTSLFGYYSRFNGGFYSVLSYVIIYYGTILFVSKQQLPALLRSLFLGAIAAALYAFPEHFGHSPSCLLITGQFTADCWIQDVQSRIFGTLGQPNWLAAYMVVMVPLAVANIFSSRPKIKEEVHNRKAAFQVVVVDEKQPSFAWQPLAYAVSALTFTLVLLYTKSRSGILGAGIAFLLQSAVYVLLVWRRQSKNSQTGALLLRLLPTVVFCILVLLIANPVRDKIEQVFHFSFSAPNATAQQKSASGTQLDNGGSESGDIRKVVWSGAIKVWLRYPVLGSGVETFAYSYYKDRPVQHNLLSEWDFLYNKAHNEFLNYLATTGTVGLIAYLVMYGSFIVIPLLWALKAKEDEQSILLTAISVSLVGLAVSNFFGFSTVVVSLLTFLLPAVAVRRLNRERMVAVDVRRLLQSNVVQSIGIGLACIVAAYYLIGIYRMYDIDVAYAQSKAMIDHQEVQTGVALLQDVVDRSPDEPVYRDEFAYTAARLSYALATTGESTSAAKLAQAAIDQSDEVLRQNSVNVNFYKTRARIFTFLGQISPEFYTQAAETLKKARDLSPTDPKLTYNLALLAKARGDDMEYEKQLLETIALRPIDLQARQDLAQLYVAQKKTETALKQYQQMLQYDPENVGAKNAIASLSAIQKKK